ncbi:MAG: hypothetical protein SGI77_17715 [Pirellulaceae bacterium]|nr:hypothetical protein [Pirellulaceae bacterium]
MSSNISTGENFVGPRSGISYALHAFLNAMPKPTESADLEGSLRGDFQSREAFKSVFDNRELIEDQTGDDSWIDDCAHPEVVDALLVACASRRGRQLR